MIWVKNILLWVAMQRAYLSAVAVDFDPALSGMFTQAILNVKAQRVLYLLLPRRRVHRELYTDIVKFLRNASSSNRSSTQHVDD